MNNELAQFAAMLANKSEIKKRILRIELVNNRGGVMSWSARKGKLKHWIAEGWQTPTMVRKTAAKRGAYRY